MTRPHIVCVVTNDLNQDQRMHRICSALLEAGLDVTLVGREKKGSTPLMDRPYDQIRLKGLPQKGPSFYKKYNAALKDYLLDQKPDMVYAADTDTLLGAGQAVKSLGAKFIYDAHEYFTEVPELQGQWLKKSIWSWIEKRYIPKTDLCFTVGPKLAEVFEKKYKKPFHVVRNVPFGSLLKEQERTADEKIILYQGALNKGRGLHEMIDSMKRITDKTIQLHIVGGGDLDQELRAYAASKSYKNRIHFLGWMYGEELKEATSRAWLGINLLDASSLNYKYSLANKFFDYMHAGVPSINMAFPEYKHILATHQVGLTIPSLSDRSIAQVIDNLVQDRSLYESLKENTIEARQTYCWEKEKKVLIDSIKSLL